MNNYIAKKSFLKGEIYIPSSKSIAQRAIAIATITKGQSIINNVNFSDDVVAAINLSENLGAQIEIIGNTLKIEGNFCAKNKELFVSEAGLSTRMFIPIAGLLGENFTFSGKGSILKRPMDFLIEPLKNLGLNIETTNGFLPIKINGKLKSKNIRIDASESSQLLSGILIALPLTQSETVITVDNLKSKPYIDLTIEIMNEFGIKIKHNNYQKFQIPAGKYKPKEITLEGDWSSAAFWFVAGAINGDLKIFNLNPNSKQGDKNILVALEKSGVEIYQEQDFFSVKKSKLKSFEFDATDCPDLFPALAVLAANAIGISKIKGVHRLFHKESNRAEAIVKEFRNLGINSYISEDYLIIEACKNIKGGIFNSYNDHRMAMAASILSINCLSQIEISNIDCVSKSYPSFFEHLKNIST